VLREELKKSRRWNTPRRSTSISRHLQTLRPENALAAIPLAESGWRFGAFQTTLALCQYLPLVIHDDTVTSRERAH
jgi:hypothetical protein